MLTIRPGHGRFQEAYLLQAWRGPDTAVLLEVMVLPHSSFLANTHQKVAADQYQTRSLRLSLQILHSRQLQYQLPSAGPKSAALVCARPQDLGHEIQALQE